MAQTLVKVASDFETQLAAPVSTGDTTATLVSITDDDGVALANGNYILTVDLNSSSKEYFICTLTGVNLTAISSISRQGAATSGFVRAHRRGAKIVLTDWASLGRITNLLNGTTDFDASTPLGYDGNPSITDDGQFATKKYADDLAIAGSPDASTTVKGISKMSTAPASPTEPIAVGTNDPRVPTQDENNALAGTSGTPSTSNKYVTAADVTEAKTASKIPRRDANSDILVATTPTAGDAATSKTYVDAADISITALIPNLQQEIPTYVGTEEETASTAKFATNLDGSVGVLIFFNQAGTSTLTVQRYQRDTTTKQYIQTATATLSPGGAFSNHGVVLTSTYIYVFYTFSGTRYITRYDLADLANPTAMTISGTNWTGGVSSFSDGTNLYIYNNTSVFYKYTISGTTATYDSSITYTSAGGVNNGTSTSDGTNVWMTESTNGEIVINKYAITGGAAVSATTRYIYVQAYPNYSKISFYIPYTGVLGFGYGLSYYTSAAMIGSGFKLRAITQP